MTQEVQQQSPPETIRRIIGEAVGEASMCWQPIPAGVFDSTAASAIVDRLYKEIMGHVIMVR